MNYKFTKVFYSKETLQKISDFYGAKSEQLQSANEGDKYLPGRIQDDIDEEKAFLNDLVLSKAFSNSLKQLVDGKPISNENLESVKDATATIDTISMLSEIYASAVADRALQRQIEFESRKREKHVDESKGFYYKGEYIRGANEK